MKDLDSDPPAPKTRPPASLHEVVASCSVFCALPPEAHAMVIARLRPQTVDDGAYLFHAEQAADRLYIVVEGDLEVVRVHHGEIELLNTVEVGEMIGELAILRGGLRNASARARGRTVVYWMHADDFMTLARRWSELGLEVARRVADSFVRSERYRHGRRHAPIWCMHASLSIEFVEATIEAAARYLDPGAPGSVALVMGSPVPARPLGGATVETIALPADDEGWSAALAQPSTRCSLVVAYGTESELQGALPHCEALVVGEDAADLEPPASVRRIQITRDGLPSRNRIKARYGAPLVSVAPRLARTLLGRTVGVALGGGGALGFAHLGVLETLESMGIEVDFVLGTSMGAVVGGAYLSRGACGVRARMEQLCRPRDWMMMVDPSVVTSGALSGRRALKFLVDLLQLQRFDQLCTPFAAMALDLDTAEERVLQRGSLPDAVRASMAVPGVIMPHSYDSPFGPTARFVDGCMINNVPVDAVRAMGADRVIGVHVMAREHRPETTTPVRSKWSRRVPGLGGLARLQTAAQTYIVAMARSGERQAGMADVAILPDTSGIAFYEMWRGPEIAERGRRAAEHSRERLAVLAPRHRPG